MFRAPRARTQPSIRPPKRFRVLGQIHTMRFVAMPPDGWRPTSVGGSELNEQAIWVRDDLSTHQQIETYLHEVLHSILYLGGIRQHMPDEDDEALVNALSPQLLHFLRDNPRVVAYLTQKMDNAA